jgi:hypothetical protein
MKKLNKLITIAIITLLALTSIEAYLIYNTYELKEDVFLTETRKAISRIDNESELGVVINDLMGKW